MRPTTLAPLALALALAGPTWAQSTEVPPADVAATSTEQPAAKRPVTVYVGVYIRRIEELDFKAGLAKVSYFVWCRWKGDVNGSLLEVSNGSIESKDGEYLREQDGWKYAYHRCVATVQIEADFRSFPFDTHDLTIELEHSEGATDEVVLVADVEGMKYLGSPERAGWIISPPEYSVTTHLYRTNWGMLDIPPEETTLFSRFRATMRLTHAPGVAFVKTFLPLLISMLITFLAFVIHPEELEARVGMGVAGIFGVVTSHALVAEAVPEVPYMTLADRIHALSLFFVFTTLLATCLAGHLARRDLLDRAIKIDRFVGAASTGLYFALLLTFVVRA